MAAPQSAIVAPLAPAGRFLTLSLRPDVEAKQALLSVAALRPAEQTVIGIGRPLADASTRSIPGLRDFPSLAGPSLAIPSTQQSLFVYVGGPDAGTVLLRARQTLSSLTLSFDVVEDVASFVYADSRDLSGYEDGTENPKGDLAFETAISKDETPHIAGSSFVAVQRWAHDLDVLSRMTESERDLVFGRRHADNEEMGDAPLSAHVKRSAQESYDPPAFMLRRSMPWGDTRQHGLYFVAYGATLDAFERVLRRMSGAEDGIVDGLFRFSKPLTGGYYWCPPSADDRLDLRALGIGL